MVTKEGHKIPDFFVVGAAKSGSTSLWYYLGQHPEVFVTKDIKNKELGFFSLDYGVNNISEYSFFFDKATENQKIGEICHAYLSSPESAKFIKRYNPNAKIIIVLRNPIERAFSLYSWMVENGYEYLSFKSAIKREKKILDNPKVVNKPFFHSYFRNYLYSFSGLYSEQLRNFYEIFESKNIMILTSEQLKNKKYETLTHILIFLGIKNISFKFETSNQNTTSKTFRSSLHFLNKNYVPLVLSKIKFPNRLIIKLQKFVEKFTIKKKKPKIPETVKNDLKKFFEFDIQRTSEITKMDLTKWLK